jgi:hypothetical protein
MNVMKPEDSLPCSKEHSTGPYPEPDQYNPYHPILSLSDPETTIEKQQAKIKQHHSTKTK